MKVLREIRALMVGVFLTGLVFLPGIAVAGDAGSPTLVIATYDSFIAKGGLGPEIFPLFEKHCGCKVQALALGDSGQLLSRLQLDTERGKSTAHVVLGLDQTTWERAKPYLETWGEPPRRYESVPKALRVGSGFLPFDYGVFAFMSDREQLEAAHLQPPRKLADLLAPGWRRQLILEDPRTSTPGLAFVLYADASSTPDFWPRFRSQWLTLTPGWDGAYGLFLKKEAPLVWSYTTSQAYHEEHGDHVGRYRALVFDQGNPAQIEGAAIVRGLSVDSRKRAREFLEFLLTPEVQSLIPLHNWMFPVMTGTRLPESFKHVPKPVRLVPLPTGVHEIDDALSAWKSAIRVSGVELPLLGSWVALTSTQSGLTSAGGKLRASDFEGRP